MSSIGRGSAPRRVRVTSPRRAARPDGRRSRYRDLHEETALGEVYLDSLLRAQRRLAMSLLMGIVLMVVVLPLLLSAVPDDLTLGQVRANAAWWGLGLGVYPVAWLLTAWYVRAAERLESEFVELMDLP